MKTIVWAIDPHRDSKQLSADARQLGAWFPKSNGEVIRPVFILTPGAKLLPFGIVMEQVPKLRQEAYEKFEQLRRFARLPLAQPAVLLHPSDHVEDVAQAILRYAKLVDADLIALRTRGRKGFARLVNGSLAETLLKNAELPVLVFTPGSNLRTRAETQLFRSDRAREQEGLRRVA